MGGSRGSRRTEPGREGDNLVAKGDKSWVVMGGRQPQLHGQKRHKVCKGPSKCRREGRGGGWGGGGAKSEKWRKKTMSDTRGEECS